MDIARPPQKKRKKYVYIALGVVGLLSVTIFLQKLEPAAPTVDRGTLWIDSVRKGTMLREVRAPGTLVPERIRLVSALTAGRVEQIPIRPGTAVMPGTKILELSNPDVQLQFLEALRQLTAAEGERINLRTNLETTKLNQQGAVSQIRGQYSEAKRTLATIEALDARKLSSANEVATARERASDLEQRLAIEEKRLEIVTNTVERQLDLQQANINRLRAIADFQRDRVASMIVLAGDPGVLQEMSLELGQYVVPGQLLAKVAQPGRLKAVLRVPETQVKDIVIGQKVSIDTRNGIIPGHVMRIDPSVLNTTVAVEVALDSTLPKGARADLSVDGTVEIERLDNVMFINRPAYGQPESTVGIFKLLPDGKSAARVNVKLGRSSVNTIEVIQGLNIGDKVIVSDMSAWDSNERVKLRQ